MISNENIMFPKEENIIEIYANYDKPICFLYLDEGKQYLTTLYQMDDTYEDWLLISADSIVLEMLKNTRLSLYSFIAKSETIKKVRTNPLDQNKVIETNEVEFSHLNKEYLPNMDSYLNGSQLFNLKYHIDGYIVENLIKDYLSAHEFHDSLIRLENQFVDLTFVDANSRTLVETKYYKFSKNVDLLAIMQHIMRLIERYKLTDNLSTRLIYNIVLKNLNENHANLMLSIEALNNNLSDLGSIDIRTYDVYKLIEQRSEKFNFSKRKINDSDLEQKC